MTGESSIDEAAISYEGNLNGSISEWARSVGKGLGLLYNLVRWILNSLTIFRGLLDSVPSERRIHNDLQTNSLFLSLWAKKESCLLPFR